MRLTKIFGFVSLAAMLALMPACSSGGGAVGLGTSTKPPAAAGTGFSNLAKFEGGTVGSGANAIRLDTSGTFGENTVMLQLGSEDPIIIYEDTERDKNMGDGVSTVGYTFNGAPLLGPAPTLANFAALNPVVAGMSVFDKTAFSGVLDVDDIIDAAMAKIGATTGTPSNKLTAGKNQILTDLKTLVDDFNGQLKALNDLLLLGGTEGVTANIDNAKTIFADYDGSLKNNSSSFTVNEDGISFNSVQISPEVLILLGFAWDSSNQITGSWKATNATLLAALDLEESSDWKATGGYLKSGLTLDGAGTLGADAATLELPDDPALLAALFEKDGVTPPVLEFKITRNDTQPAFGTNLTHAVYGYNAKRIETASTDPDNNNSAFTGGAVAINPYVMWDKGASAAFADGGKATSGQLKDMLVEDGLQLDATFKGNTVAILSVDKIPGNLYGDATLKFVHDGKQATTPTETLDLEFANWYNVFFGSTTSQATILYKDDKNFGDLKLTAAGTGSFNKNQPIAVAGTSNFSADYYAPGDDLAYAEAAGTYSINDATKGKFGQEIILKGAFGVSADKNTIKITEVPPVTP